MKKVCHVMVASYFNDGMGYQENILSKKHVQLGFEVTVITPCRPNKAPEVLVNPDGVCIHTIPLNTSLLKKVPFFRGYSKIAKGLYDKLKEIAPDIIFVHSLAFPDAVEVVKYKKENPDVKVFADNHQDYYNKPVNTLKEKFQRYSYARPFAKKLAKVCEMTWGVTPWRVKYMCDVLGVPKEKAKLLVMGGDEDFIDWEHREEIRKAVREKCGIPQDAFLLISGGKMDLTKNIHLLIEALHYLNDESIYLLLFGSIDDETTKKCSQYLNDRIINIGWIKSNEVYQYFLSSDLGVFPGTHSVLWEQACASGLPCIFKDWNGGFDHVDVGGNSILMKDVTAQEIAKQIKHTKNTPSLYIQMKEVAGNKGRKEFTYIEIAKRAIQID